MSSPNNLRVLLVDDQLLFVESLKCVLEEKASDIDVIGVAGDGTEAISLTLKLAPDIVLMDVRMPKMDGVEAARRIRELCPKVKIVMLTTFDDDDYVHVALKFGAIGYLLKNIPPEELIRSIRAVRYSVSQISPEILEKLVKSGDDEFAPAEIGKESIKPLTMREREILQLIIDAKENHEIAEALCLSEQTVKNHIHNIYAKLGVSNRLQLIKALGRITPQREEKPAKAPD